MLPLPLPGTGVPKRGLFISRWSGLLAKPERGGLPAFHSKLLTPGSIDLLFRILHQQWNLYLIGNEDAVAHGRASDEQWKTFEDALLAHLSGNGVRVFRHYACLENPEGKGKHKRDSVFLFPNTGALYHAAQEDGIQLSESWLVSGDVEELAAGWRSGCRVASIAAKTGGDRELEVDPQLSAPTLADALATLCASDEYARR